MSSPSKGYSANSSKGCNGFTGIPSYCLYLYAVLQRTGIRSRMPHTQPMTEEVCDNAIIIVKKKHVDTLFNHLNSVDSHICSQWNPQHRWPFLDTKCLPNKDYCIQTSVYRQPTHTCNYLDWNSNHPVSAKK